MQEVHGYTARDKNKLIVHGKSRCVEDLDQIDTLWIYTIKKKVRRSSLNN